MSRRLESRWFVPLPHLQITVHVVQQAERFQMQSMLKDRCMPYLLVQVKLLVDAVHALVLGPFLIE